MEWKYKESKNLALWDPTRKSGFPLSQKIVLIYFICSCYLSFRCKICRSSLLFDPYTHHGSDTSSLICAHHVKDAPTSPVDLSQQTGSTDNKPRCGFQTGFSGLYSLDGSAITSVPCYAQTAAPQADEEHRSVVDGEGRGETVRTSELSSACGSGTGRPARPVPAPRQSLDSTLVPVPALKSAQTPSSSSAAGIVVAVLVLFSLIDDITEL